MEYEDNLDLKKIFLKHISWWPIFILSLLLTISAAYLYNNIAEPVYSARATLLISEEPRQSPLMPDMARPAGRESWQNEIAVLQSRTLINEALQNMNSTATYYELEMFFGLTSRREIYDQAPFTITWDREHPQPFGSTFQIKILSDFSYVIEIKNGKENNFQKSVSQFGDNLEGQGHSFLVELTELYNRNLHEGKIYEFVFDSNRDLVTRYLRKLSVEPVSRESSVLEITFEATNRQRAVDFISNLTQMYIQQNLAEKNSTAQNTILFVDEQLEGVSENLRDTESDLQQFRERHQVMEVGPLATQLTAEVQELDRQKSIEEVKLQYYDLLMEYIRDDREFSEVFGPAALGIEDPLLNNLLMELSRLHNERVRMLLTTTANTPAAKAIDESIRQSKANLNENIQSLRAASQIMTNDLNQRISRIEQRIGGLPQTERELINIQRLFNLSEATYNYLLEKRAEAGIGLASIVPDHKILDPAHSDSTTSPKKALNYILAIGLGMIAPMLILGIRNFFNTKILDMEEVTKLIDYPVVGLIPHFSKIKKLRDPNPVLFDETKSSIVEAFRSMRSNLLLLAPDKKSKLIVVTSTREQEGKTFTALNLAGAIYLLNRKTIYINADMRKPSTLFNGNISRVEGLSTYLTGQIESERLIDQSGSNGNLYLIPSGKMPPNSAELIDSVAMEHLLEKLQSFEFIIIDTPPIGLVSDAMPLITKADILVYVLRHGYSQQSDLDFLRELAKNVNPRKVALAINDVKSKGRYGYGYGYGYGLGYGIGYGGENKSQKKKSKSAY